MFCKSLTMMVLLLNYVEMFFVVCGVMLVLIHCGILFLKKGKRLAIGEMDVVVVGKLF